MVTKDNHLTIFVCPLCNGLMCENNGRLVCASNHTHILSFGEYNRWQEGEKEKSWLAARAKVRLGKIIHKR